MSKRVTKKKEIKNREDGSNERKVKEELILSNRKLPFRKLK